MNKPELTNIADRVVAAAFKATGYTVAAGAMGTATEWQRMTSDQLKGMPVSAKEAAEGILYVGVRDIQKRGIGKGWAAEEYFPAMDKINAARVALGLEDEE